MQDLPLNKILKFLIAGIVFASLLILTKEVILKPKPLPILEIPSRAAPIQIDFDLLKSPEVQALLPFEEISLPEEIGRENPFESYEKLFSEGVSLPEEIGRETPFESY